MRVSINGTVVSRLIEMRSRRSGCVQTSLTQTIPSLSGTAAAAAFHTHNRGSRKSEQEMQR